MTIAKRNIFITGLFLFFCGFTKNLYAEEVAVEWAPFVKRTNISDKQLVIAANLVNSEFLIKQKGFIKRELIKKNDKEYADVIHWQTKADAITASEKVNTCVVCGDYFKLMKMEVKTGEGFSYYTIIKNWES